MPKAGLFAGEVTQEAPADGAVTTKDKGYHWMEWGNVAQAPDQSRVTAWWGLEEATGGSFFFDEVASYVCSPQNGITQLTGVVGNSTLIQELFSVNHVVEVSPDSQIITMNNQVWSCSFWYKTPAVLAGQAGRYVLSQWRDASVAIAATYRRFRVIYNATENGFISSIFPSSNYLDPAVDIDTGDISLQADTWYHFVCTHDPVPNGGSGEISFTVSERGGTVGTRLTADAQGGAFLGTPTPVTAVATTLGRAFSGEKKSDGSIDEMAFWIGGTILSEQDVFELFTYELGYSDLENPALPTAIVTDSFTDVDATPIASHTPNLDTVGGGWILDFGGLTIDSNSLLPSNLVTTDTCRIDAGVASAIVTVSGNTSWVDNSNFGYRIINVHVDAGATTGYQVYLSPALTTNLFIYSVAGAGGVMVDLDIPALAGADNTPFTLEVTVIGEKLIAKATVAGFDYIINTTIAINNTADTHYGLSESGLGVYTMRPFDSFSITTIP